MARATRRLKRVFGYMGSKETADFVNMAALRLLGSDQYAEIFRREPERLQRMMHQVIRALLIDEFKAASAQKRPPRALARELDEEASATPATSHEVVEHQQLLGLLQQELQLFEQGVTSARVRPANRAAMARAVLLKLGGDTDADIAAQLGRSKATINNWLQFMTAHLSRRLAAGGMEAG